MQVKDFQWKQGITVKELMSQMSGFLTGTLETITAEAIRSFKS